MVTSKTALRTTLRLSVLEIMSFFDFTGKIVEFRDFKILRLISSPNVSFRVLEFWIVESLVHSLVSLRLVFFGGSYFKFLYPTVLLE
jgi:hypothetical protein